MRFISSVIIFGIFSTYSALGFLLNKHYSGLSHRNSVVNLRTHSNVRSSNRGTILFSSKEPDDIDETTRKYGLEAGLYKAATAKPEDGQKIKPQDLLKKYGTAYLATSITLAIISYAICYFLISTGVDVTSLLEKVGIKSSAAAANTGTAAIAYAVHKAASPIRFPPTVALTPVVAGWLGKKTNNTEEEKK
jgi:hypothetical protein